MDDRTSAAGPRPAALVAAVRRWVVGSALVALLAAGAGELLTSPMEDDRGSPPATPVAPIDAPERQPEASSEPTERAPAVPVRSAALSELAVTGADGPAQPVRLVISDVGIDMPVGPVGVGEDGQMSVPDDVDAVGWYKFGAAPGATAGTAVLASHVDSWAKGVGPFARLRHEVMPGTRVLVTTADGTTLTYEVADNRMIPKPELPVDDLFDRGGPPRLVLVTCGGRFQRDIGRYTDNIVVTAVPVAA